MLLRAQLSFAAPSNFAMPSSKVPDSPRRAADNRAMSGNRGDLDKVLLGIEAADKAGLKPIKINVVVQRGVNDHTVLDLLEHFRGTGHIVRLIEYMDVGNRNAGPR